MCYDDVDYDDLNDAQKMGYDFATAHFKRVFRAHGPGLDWKSFDLELDVVLYLSLKERKITTQSDLLDATQWARLRWDHIWSGPIFNY